MTEIRLDDRIVWALARTCRPGDVLIVGVATPIAAAAAQLAREVLVPDLMIIEAGAVDPDRHDIAQAFVSPEQVAKNSAGVMTQNEMLETLQRHRVTRQFVSPAQVDGAGRLNTSRVRDTNGNLTRLPGGLATADVAALVGNLVAYRADHSPRFLPASVDFVTGGAGHVAGIVTSKAVLAHDGVQFRVASIHPGVDAAEVAIGCSFPLAVTGSEPFTEEPPAEAIELLRTVIDPHGICRLETRAGRDDALAALATITVLAR